MSVPKNKPAPNYRYDWANGKALVSFRGKCIAEANWDAGAPNPKEVAAKNGQLIADALNAYNEHAALVAVAEAADKVIKANNVLLEAQRQGDDDAMAHATIALYGELETLSTARNK